MNTKNAIKLFVLVLFTGMSINKLKAQNKVKLGVISMDTRGLEIDNATMTNLVHLELEKANVFEVLDRYDVASTVQSRGINVNDCFGKSCLVKIGKMLGADKMLSGSMEKYGNKIVFIFRLVDVEKERIEKTDVVEFIDQQDEIQIMARIGLNNIMGIENDQYLLDLLVNYDQPITSQRNTLNLNGPRVGASFVSGRAGKRLQASKQNGGYNMYPLSTLIGYQYEKQFISSGDFQALLEVLPAINGLESGIISPSLSTLLGFRLNKSGIEIGMGPVFRLNQKAKGFYDENGTWVKLNGANAENIEETQIIEEIDSRGKYKLSTGMIIAVGKTVRSGYLNIPINAYWNPRKEGHIFGITLGFNVASIPKLTKE